MWNKSLYLYVEYKFEPLCGIQTCTFMWNTNLYLYVHLPVYYNACGKPVFRHLMLLYGCLAVTEQNPNLKLGIISTV